MRKIKFNSILWFITLTHLIKSIFSALNLSIIENQARIEENYNLAMDIYYQNQLNGLNNVKILFVLSVFLLVFMFIEEF